MNVDELNTLISAYELATFTLSTSLDRLHHIIAAGIDVHTKTYTTCIERIETVKSILPELQQLLEELRAVKEEVV